jgi:AAA domain
MATPDLTNPVDYAVALEQEKAVRRIRREADQAVKAETRGPVALPAIATLRERLALPRQETQWRIHGWQPQGSRVICAAQFKAGKTTLIGNTARCLVDGDLFLGRDVVIPVSGTVALIDLEMGEAQLDDWLRDQGIRHDDRLVVIPMRGRGVAFDILDPVVRADWASRLRARAVDYLILDCFRPLMDALGLDEHRDAGRLLVAFDALLAEAGIAEALVVHHMGHTNERSRGDSRLRDWPDIEWRLMREDDDPASQRFITAYGRDVSMPESQLDYDFTTRRLMIAGGSRRDMKAVEALSSITATLKDGEMSGRAIKAALRDSDHSKRAIEAALKTGAKTGALATKDGPNNGTLYFLPVSVPVSRSVPSVSRNTTPTSVPVRLIRFRGHFPRGGYDVHDGRHETEAAPPQLH